MSASAAFNLLDELLKLLRFRQAEALRGFREAFHFFRFGGIVASGARFNPDLENCADDPQGVVETGGAVILRKAIPPFDAIGLGEVFDRFGLRVRPRLEKGVQAFLMICLGLGFEVRGCVDSLDVHPGGGLERDARVAPRGEQFLFVPGFFDFVRQALGGGAQNVRVQAAPNRMKRCEPDWRTLFSARGGWRISRPYSFSCLSIENKYRKVKLPFDGQCIKPLF